MAVSLLSVSGAAVWPAVCDPGAARRAVPSDAGPVGPRPVAVGRCRIVEGSLGGSPPDAVPVGVGEPECLADLLPAHPGRPGVGDLLARPAPGSHLDAAQDADRLAGRD